MAIPTIPSLGPATQSVSTRSTRPSPTKALEGAIRAEIGRGIPLSDRLRDALERAYGAHLDGIRLHDDETADHLAASIRADAFTAGADVFFRAGSLRPDSDAGLELLAHEVAHAVQQSGSRLLSSPEVAEREAAAFAGAFARGCLPDRPRRRRVRALSKGDALVLQCHSSWEHRMLGDLRTVDFAAIAAGGANRKNFLERVQQYLRMWETNPKAVNAERIRKEFDNIRPLTLRGSGLVVTYGELNTLADYLASPAELDALPGGYLLPILQQVRQEGYAWVSWVIENRWLDKQVYFGGFEDSVADTFGWDTADSIWETRKMDAFTEAFGPRGIDHYTGLLARNACHFAPHSWYRWEQFYLQARAFAEEAYHAKGDRRARLTNLAWIHHGYADHFLQDSFAAGHLINKTLVMQWYLDWVAPTWTAVPDWDLVQFMNLARQPDLAGRSLYSAFTNPAARGDVRDPQTASEHWSVKKRMQVSGVRADGSTQEASYKRWLAFLGNGVVQLASNSVHNHFNESSLLVSSEAHPQAFQIYGDNTMIRGGNGYQIANETAQLSQKSISDLLDKGTTEVNAADIFRHFPTKVHDPQKPATSQSLEAWAYGFKDQAVPLFDGVKNRAVGAFRSRIAPVNIDNTGGWRWSGIPGKATDIAVGGDGLVWSIGALGSDGNGPVQRWNPASTASWDKQDGAGVRIAADGAGVLWVVNAAGYSYRKPRGAKNWERGQLPKVRGVDGLVDIAAGTDGSVWGLAKATVPGGHQLMRCVPGNGTHTWEPVSGGATAVSVGPDGLPWTVNDGGVVMNLTPGKGPDRFNGPGAVWTNVSPNLPGNGKSTDVGVGVGSLLHAWVTTDSGMYAWNGRRPNNPAQGARLLLDWEAMGGAAVRIATGYDGLPWVVNAKNDIYRLVAGGEATAAFTTSDAGKVTGRAVAAAGSLFQGETVSINGSTDLSKVIVGNSGARVNWIKLDRSMIPGVFYTLSINGRGPSGAGSGSMYIYIEDEGGFTDYKWFWSSQEHTLTIDYNGTKAGIKRISWSESSTDPH